MLILASQSPRRRELMQRAGLTFRVETRETEEVNDASLPPVELCARNASAKAEAVAACHPEDTVVGADTLVFLGGVPLGKPADRQDAIRMLSTLQGRTHCVCTAVAVILPGGARRDFAEVSYVTFRPLSQEEIGHYLDVVPVLDKAGAYAVQDHAELIIERVEGDFDNVVGLPVTRLAQVLESAGIFSKTTQQHMTYDFDTPIDRRGSGSLKWDITPAPDILPLWIADMDFRVAPAITDAIRKRAEHGVFGYVHVPEEYYSSVINWFSRRHGWKIEREHMLYTLGVVPAIAAILRATTTPGDKVLLQAPVYNAFFSCVRNFGLECVSNDLIYEDAHYSIDWEDLEKKAADPMVKVMLLCNPHNPAGRVWTPEELRRIGDICIKNEIFMIVDEIHCEFAFEGYHYTPFGSLSPEFLKNSAICSSSSKPFNTAGLQMANIVVADPRMRARINKAINIHETCDVNPFAPVAMMAAYNEGEEWLKQMMAYIEGNYNFLVDFFAKNLPQFPVTKMEGTYLAWVDISSLGKGSKEVTDELMEKGRVWLNPGVMYGEPGDRFIRVNMACPRSVLADGLNRVLSVWG